MGREYENPVIDELLNTDKQELNENDIEELICGNDNAWNKFYILNQFDLNLIAAKIVGFDHSKDIVHESILKAFRNIHTFDNSRSLYPWIYTIVKNTALDYHRKNKRKSVKETFISNNESNGEDIINEETIHFYNDSLYDKDTEDIVINSLEANKIIDALYQLPEIYREPLKLRLEGFTHEEISQKLCIYNISTLKSYLHRAREKVKQILYADKKWSHPDAEKNLFIYPLDAIVLLWARQHAVNKYPLTEKAYEEIKEKVNRYLCIAISTEFIDDIIAKHLKTDLRDIQILGEIATKKHNQGRRVAKDITVFCEYFVFRKTKREIIEKYEEEINIPDLTNNLHELVKKNNWHDLFDINHQISHLKLQQILELLHQDASMQYQTIAKMFNWKVNGNFASDDVIRETILKYCNRYHILQPPRRVRNSQQEPIDIIALSSQEISEEEIELATRFQKLLIKFAPKHNITNCDLPQLAMFLRLYNSEATTLVIADILDNISPHLPNNSNNLLYLTCELRKLGLEEFVPKRKKK